MTSTSTTESDRLLDNDVNQRERDDWPSPDVMGQSGATAPSGGTYLKDSLLLKRAGSLAQVSSNAQSTANFDQIAGNAGLENRGVT